MSNFSFNIQGQDMLMRKLRQNMQKTAVKGIVKKHTAEMNVQTQKNMANAYKGHYEDKKFVSPTGNTRRNTFVENGDFSGMVYVDTDYIEYLEFGTRFMNARPAVGPAWRRERPLFLKDLWDLVR